MTLRPLGVRVVCNLYDVRTKAARKIVNQLRDTFGDLMTDTPINMNTKLKSAAAVGQPITEFDRTSLGFQDFISLAREIIEKPATVEATQPAQTDLDVLQQADRISRQAQQLLADSADLVSGTVSDRIGSGAAEPADSRGAADATDPLDALGAETVDEKLDQLYGFYRTDSGAVLAVEAPEAESVCVAGDFNNWSPHSTPLQKRHDRWVAAIDLAPGTYQYRLVIDGKWQHDPHATRTETNPFGDLNSVVEIH
jgi:hypothetical protein